MLEHTRGGILGGVGACFVWATRSSRASVPRLPYMASDATTRTPTSTAQMRRTKNSRVEAQCLTHTHLLVYFLRFAPSRRGSFGIHSGLRLIIYIVIIVTIIIRTLIQPEPHSGVHWRNEFCKLCYSMNPKPAIACCCTRCNA